MKFSEMTPWLLFAAILTIAGAQTSLTDQNIQSAVLSWLSNEPSARETYGDIKDWDTSLVTDFNQLFASMSIFNEDISNWDTSAATTMAYMFNGAKEFNQPIGRWNVSQVTDFDFFLGGASAFNQDLKLWKLEKATTMSFMFMGASSFNGDIGGWDVSSVQYFNGMLFAAKSFNQYIGSWDVSKATSFASMFYGATSFNQDISSWNTSNVNKMDLMFMRASSFNVALNDWDVSNVESMKKCFSSAYSFNQYLSDWDVSSVTDMSGIFDEAISFQQVLCWNVRSTTDVKDAFCGSDGDFNVTCTGALMQDMARLSCPITLAPTVTSAPTITQLPSISPSKSPSKSPSSSPSGAPSPAPDETIQPQPCGVDQNGSYGMSNGVSMIAEYHYEMRTSVSISGSQATYLVELLEPEITSAVARSLFPDCDQRQRQLSSLVGINIAPVDQILNQGTFNLNNILSICCGNQFKTLISIRFVYSGNIDLHMLTSLFFGKVGCTEGTESTASSCYVVKGELTMYSLFGEDINSTLETIDQIIIFQMENDVFDFQTDDGIDVSTTYRDKSTIPSARGVSTGGSDDGDYDDNLNWLWSIAGVTGGLFLMYGGVRILKRRADNIRRIETEEFVLPEPAEKPPREPKNTSLYDHEDALLGVPRITTKRTDTEQGEIFQDEPFNEEKEGGESPSDSASDGTNSDGNSSSTSSSSSSSGDDDDDDDSSSSSEDDDLETESNDYDFDKSRSAEFAKKFHAKVAGRASFTKSTGEKSAAADVGDNKKNNEETGKAPSTQQEQQIHQNIPPRGGVPIRNASLGEPPVEQSNTSNNHVTARIGSFEAQIAAAAKSHSSTAYEV